MAEGKRIRRGFAQIILDKVDEKGSKLTDQSKYNKWRRQLEDLMMEFDQLVKDDSATRLTKGKVKRLSKFSKAEIEAYLKTL